MAELPSLDNAIGIIKNAEDLNILSDYYNQKNYSSEIEYLDLVLYREVLSYKSNNFDKSLIEKDEELKENIIYLADIIKKIREKYNSITISEVDVTGGEVVIDDETKERKVEELSEEKEKVIEASSILNEIIDMKKSISKYMSDLIFETNASKIDILRKVLISVDERLNNYAREMKQKYPEISNDIDKIISK